MSEQTGTEAALKDLAHNRREEIKIQLRREIFKLVDEIVREAMLDMFEI